MKVTIVKSDDWEALYIKGVLVKENHRLSSSDILDAIGLECTFKWLSDEQLEELNWEYPKNEADLPNEG